MMNILVGSEGIESRGQTFTLPKAKQKTLKDFRVAIKLSSPMSDVEQSYQDSLTALGTFLKRKREESLLRSASGLR